VFVDAKQIAEAVFGDHLLANVLLLGAAFQAGGLPLSLADVAQAMERQGRSSRRNREAFEWGRWAVHDSAVVTAALAGTPESARRDPYEPTARAMTAAAGLVAETPLAGETGLAGPVRDLVLRRTAQVIDYQSPAVGRKFLALVTETAARDCEAEGWRLTRAVIAAWFKLLTYKDEYEVARLHLAVDWAAEVGADSGAGSGPGRVTYHLHPPVLRRLGMKHKLPLGAPYALAFRVLARMKRLRGTPLDVFGWDPDRRLERDLITEFPGLLAARSSYADAVALAESVLGIKGYAAVKEASVAAWRAGLAEPESAATAETAS
jgi:indolepyruvate ferredoxin oxidoreductase